MARNVSKIEKPKRVENSKGVAAVDDLLAGVGLAHGRRLIRRDSPRYRRQEPDELVETPPTELAIHREGAVEVLVAPRWQKTHVPHAFSTRRGGVSTAYFPDKSPAGEIRDRVTERAAEGTVAVAVKQGSNLAISVTKWTGADLPGIHSRFDSEAYAAMADRFGAGREGQCGARLHIPRTKLGGHV